METRQLVRRAILLSLVSAFYIVAVYPISMALAGDKPAPSVRFYKLNKKGQQTSYMFLRNSEEPGCHNFSRTRPVHRFAQAGFAWCQLFSEKNCKQADLVQAMWDGRRYEQVEIDEEQPQPRLYEGSRWLLSPEDNVKIRSWYCEAIKE